MRGIVRPEDERAVAPVIAEILLVAITVSITGVLYATANQLTAQAVVVNRPFVALGAVRVQDGAATIPVVAVDRAVSWSNYRVNLVANGVVGKPAALPPVGSQIALSANGASYAVTWTDLGGTGLVNSGDSITIQATGGSFPASTSYAFFLIWTDGTALQSVSWST